MALIELASNHDVNAIVDAIRSLKQENDMALEFAKSFAVPFASAFFGVVGAYKMQARTIEKQSQVQRVIELNKIAREIDRLANLLKNLKAYYLLTPTEDPYKRMVATRKCEYDLEPPRFHPSGNFAIEYPMATKRTLTESTIETLLANFKICFGLWQTSDELHKKIAEQMPVYDWLHTDILYENYLRASDAMALSRALALADDVIDFTDYLLLESHHVLVGIHNFTKAKYNKKRINEAGGLFAPKTSKSTTVIEFLRPSANGEEAEYLAYFKMRPSRTYVGRFMPVPSHNEVEKVYKTGVST